jgi:anti-sigma-K factor RskA
VKAVRDDLHVLAGSYVLDAISETEREDFERHLQSCPTCDAEVRGLRETAARLALACAVNPPARMEQHVLAATYQTRQLPPLAASRPGRVLRFPRRLAILAAAASAAAALALGITQLTAQHQLDQARATAIARVVTAPDAHVDTARAAGGSVTVVTSIRLHEAVVSTSGMASLPSSRVYQVWVMSPSGARSAGLVQGSSLLASAVRPGDQIGITVEPAGGTARPTTTPVAVLPV